MEIKHSPAIAGQPLNIDVRVGNRWANLFVFLDGEKLLHKRFDCPDPPCHESVTLQLRIDAREKTLQLRGEDPDGVQNLEILVK